MHVVKNNPVTGGCHTLKKQVEIYKWNATATWGNRCYYHLSLNREGHWGTTWFRKQFTPFSPVHHCPLWLCELQACPFPYVVFPPLPLSALSSFPFHCALQDGFGQTDEWETWPYHCSLRLFTIVRKSSSGSIACWIWAWTSSLVTWSLYEIRSISQ